MSKLIIEQISNALGEYFRTLESADDFSEGAAAEVAFNAIPERIRKLLNAAPDLLDCTILSVNALNSQPRFKVGHTDSYKIAVSCDKAITKAN